MKEISESFIGKKVSKAVVAGGKLQSYMQKCSCVDNTYLHFLQFLPISISPSARQPKMLQ